MGLAKVTVAYLPCVQALTNYFAQHEMGIDMWWLNILERQLLLFVLKSA